MCGAQGDRSIHRDLPRLEEVSIPTCMNPGTEDPGYGPGAGMEGVELAWGQLEGCQGPGSSLFLSLNQWQTERFGWGSNRVGFFKWLNPLTSAWGRIRGERSSWNVRWQPWEVVVGWGAVCGSESNLEQEVSLTWE